MASSSFNVQIVCDLNIDKYENQNWTYFIEKTADVLCIVSLGRVEKLEIYTKFLKDVCENYSHVILVPGDTEYFSYESSVEIIEGQLYSIGRHFKNLTILNNSYIDIDCEKRIFGSVLWSHITSQSSHIKLPINSIDPNESCGSHLWVNRAHFTSLYELDRVIKKSTVENKKLIVLTHYGPSINMCVKNSIKERADRFYLASENDKYFMTPPIRLWIYGHTGHNIDEMVVKNLRLVSNQHSCENYNRKKVLEISND